MRASNARRALMGISPPMRWSRRLMVVLATCLISTAPAAAHPVPFSYLDLRIQPDAIEASLVIHVIDLVKRSGVHKFAISTDREPAGR